MNTILRAGLGALLAAILAVGPALAIEYEEIFQMTADGATDEEIVRLIVEDGRGFELTATELEDLRSAGVSDFVIDVMQDPELGRRWLAGEDVEPYADPNPSDPYGGGYATDLDEAYRQGYDDGQRSTALVYSFGYYYGPLARYYYVDPFYYSFWWGGYGYAYWPSYYAYWYRPAYSWCYTYPYNYYTYDSYYCHTYYDPGYWVANGYTVQPGYGRTVWDDGPRWRDGGVAPVKGGRPAGETALTTRLPDGTRYRNPSSPPAIREALASRDRGGRSAQVADLGTKTRTPSRRTVGDVVRGGSRSGERIERSTGSVRGPRVERGTVARGGDTARGRSAARDVSKGRVIRAPESGSETIERGRGAVERGQRKSVERGDRGTIDRGQRGSVDRGDRAAAGRERARTTVRRDTPREIASRLESSPRGRARDRGYARSEDRVNVIRGNRESAPSLERRSATQDRVRVVRGNDGARRMSVQSPRHEAAPRPEASASRGGGRGGSRVQASAPSRQESAPAPSARSGGGDGGGRGHAGGGHGGGRGAGGGRGR